MKKIMVTNMNDVEIVYNDVNRVVNYNDYFVVVLDDESTATFESDEYDWFIIKK